MSWFGGGGSSSSGSSSNSSSSDFSHDDSVGYSDSGSGSGGGGMGSAMAELQQAGMVLQQQMLVQQVINDLSDRSYEKCITSKPSDTLSGSQVACVRATVNKWLDTNEYITGRLAKKQQQAQQQHSQF